MKTNNSKVFQVDVEKVIRTQRNRFIKKLPKFAVVYLKRVLREKELNEIAYFAGEATGIEFIRRCMQKMNITYKIHHKENIPSSGRFIFVCNHPLGGIDFFTVILSLADYFKNINVIANEILVNVSPLKDMFIPVNVFGKNPEKTKEEILRRMASEEIQMMTFPSGNVARKFNGKQDDGVWNKSFIRNAVTYKRDVVPIYIDAENSKKFYRTAKFRKFLGIKADIELFLLPQELVKQKNNCIDVYFGKPISYKTFDKTKDYKEWAAYIKDTVYDLKK